MICWIFGCSVWFVKRGCIIVNLNRKFMFVFVVVIIFVLVLSVGWRCLLILVVFGSFWGRCIWWICCILLIWSFILSVCVVFRLKLGVLMLF